MKITTRMLFSLELQGIQRKKLGEKTPSELVPSPAGGGLGWGSTLGGDSHLENQLAYFSRTH